jgi:tetratricopeptide (TPR) repeat protein
MMRKALAAALALGASLLAPVGGAAWAENSSAVAATAPSAGPRAYADLEAALREADLDQIVSTARAAYDSGGATPQDYAVLLLDAYLASDWEAASSFGAAGEGAAPNLFSPFVTLERSGIERALPDLQDITLRLPDPLSDYGMALMLEAAGRLEDAASIYSVIERGATLTPLDREPRDADELFRLLGEARTATIMFRAAQVQHRLRNYEEALRLYAIVAEFTPQSSRLLTEVAAAERRRAPTRAALTSRTALAQWLFVLADFANNTEGLARVFASDTPLTTIASPTAALYFQFGVLLDPQAEEYIITAAGQIIDVQGFSGADRLLARIPARSPLAADASLTRAQIALELDEDEAARSFALNAARAGEGRWAILASAADILYRVGADREAIRTLDQALRLAVTAEDQARVLSLRALAWRHLGDLDRAVADARAALETERSDDTRFAAIAVMMEHPEAWTDAVSEARALLAVNPDSVIRLNALGYTLIQRPEGLEEGFQLLWRGYYLNDRNDALVDSLGWAYYLYGQYEEALVLIERAHELTGDEPNAEILDHLGDVRWRLGDEAGAREAWTEALAARPDAPRRASLEGKLRDGLTVSAPIEREPPTVTLPQRGGRPQEET